MVQNIEEDHDAALSALVRTAKYYHGLLLHCADKCPDQLAGILIEHQEQFELGEEVLKQWCDYLEIRD